MRHRVTLLLSATHILIHICFFFSLFRCQLMRAFAPSLFLSVDPVLSCRNIKIVCTLDKFHASALNRKNNETIDGFVLTIPFRCSFFFEKEKYQRIFRFEFRRLSAGVGGTHFCGWKSNGGARKLWRSFPFSFLLILLVLFAHCGVGCRKRDGNKRNSNEWISLLGNWY